MAGKEPSEMAAEWRQEYLNRCSRCEVQSRDERCANEAQYVLRWGQSLHGSAVCRECLSEWLAVLTERHGKVEVERLT